MALAQQTKQARIDVILDAAERLIRAEAGTQFSMRALASEAGVSPATPFNLLGSKAEILQALFVRSFVIPDGQHPDQVGVDTNAIDYIFTLVAGITQRYADDAEYYRSLISGLDPSIESLLVGIAGWRAGLQFAIDQGDLRADTHVQSLAETLELGFAGSLGFWVTGDIVSARLGPQTQYAIAATLLAFATPTGEPRLHQRLSCAARALHSFGPLGTRSSKRQPRR